MDYLHAARSCPGRTQYTRMPPELFRSRSLRALGGSAPADGSRMGSGDVARGHRREFRRERCAPSAAAGRARAAGRGRAGVRRRVGVDAQRLRALSGLSSRAGRGWRIQRQIHVQPVRAARGLVCDAGEPHSPDIPQFLPGGRTLAVLGAAPRARRVSADLDRALGHYRDLAPRYDDSTRWIKAIRLRTIDALGLASGDCVLDAGCGTGWCIPLLLERVGESGRVIAFDPSHEMLAVARGRLPDKARVTLLNDTAERVRLDTSVDALLFSYTHDV